MTPCFLPELAGRFHHKYSHNPNQTEAQYYSYYPISTSLKTNRIMSTCGVCSVGFKSISALQQHERDSAKHSKRVQQQHEQRQKEEGRSAPVGNFECKACDRRFRTADALRQHTKDTLHRAADDLGRPARKTSNMAVRLECGICKRHFGSDNALLQHQRDLPGHVTGSSPCGTTDGLETTKCAPCGRQFASMEALRQHEQDSPAHASSESPGVLLEMPLHAIPVKVPVGHPAVQPNQSALQQHNPIKRSTPFQCPRCDRSFHSDDALQDHSKSSHVQPENSPWSMHPDLHEEVSQRLEADGLSVEFYEEGKPEDSIREYDTNIMGAFTCPDQSCRVQRWTSKKIAISIQLYNDEQYNAIVWHQRCRNCDSIGNLKVDVQAYVDRVVYRLSKWLGLHVQPPQFGEKRGPPHIEELCEGCRSGHCQRGYTTNPFT